MGFDKSLTITIKFIIIFCASYIHTSLYAKVKKQPEAPVVEQINVIYKNNNDSKQVAAFKSEKALVGGAEKKEALTPVLGNKKLDSNSARSQLLVAENQDSKKASKDRVTVDIFVSPKSDEAKMSAAEKTALEKKQASEKKEREKALRYRKKDSRICNNEGCVELVFGPTKKYEKPLGVLTPIRVVVYDSEDNFSHEQRYYGWDMNRDSKIDMIEKLDEDNQVVSREYDFSFDGLRNYSR